MSRKYIKSDELYIVALPAGSSGFPKPPIPGIVTGKKLRLHRYPAWSTVSEEGLPAVRVAQFRMNDGHLPDYQPRGGIEEVRAFLRTNPFAEAYYMPQEEEG